MTGKDRLMVFINHLVPDNFKCGEFSLTFNDDGSAFISIANPEEMETGSVDVVHCKECKHYKKISCVCDGCCISPDWYCAGGELSERPR